MPQPPPSQTRCRGVRAPSATGVRATMGAKSRREGHNVYCAEHEGRPCGGVRAERRGQTASRRRDAWSKEDVRPGRDRLRGNIALTVDGVVPPSFVRGRREKAQDLGPVPNDVLLAVSNVQRNTDRRRRQVRRLSKQFDATKTEGNAGLEHVLHRQRYDRARLYTDKFAAMMTMNDADGDGARCTVIWLRRLVGFTCELTVYVWCGGRRLRRSYNSCACKPSSRPWPAGTVVLSCSKQRSTRSRSRMSRTRIRYARVDRQRASSMPPR